MNPEVYNLTKLAEELTDRVEFLQKENAGLRAQSKQASKAPAAPVVSEKVARATCDALVKAGALNQDQVQPVCQAFMKDPQAAHRTICGILDAQAQAKSASETQTSCLNGGSLVDCSVSAKSSEDEFFDRMNSILRTNF